MTDAPYTPTDTMTIPLSADILRQMGNVSLCASTDKYRPILGTLRFERISSEGKGGVLMVATDSYMLAWAEVFADDLADAPSDALAAPIPAADIKRIAAFIKASDYAKRPEAFALVLSEREWLLNRRHDGATVASGPSTPGEFPNWRQLVPDSGKLESSQVSRVSINPTFLARTAKMKADPNGTGGSLRLWANVDELKSIGFHHTGANVWGLIMPIRHNGETFAAPASQAVA